MIGGVQGGYNYHLPSGLLLGVEADLTFPNYLPSNHVRLQVRDGALRRSKSVGTMSAPCAAASAMPAGPGWLTPPAVSPGPANASSIRPTGVDVEEKHINVRPGWAAGAGLEYAFAPHWSVKLEYLYSQFDRANIRFPSGAQYNSTLDFQQIRIGLNRKVDWPGSNSRTPKSDLTDPESDRWEIHGQTTYLGQGYPAFRAPYTGTNSLTPARQTRPPGATAFI